MKDIRRPDFINAAMTSRSHSSIREMLIAILIFFVGTFVGSVIQTPAMVVYLLGNKEYMAMIREGSVTTGKILDMVHDMPDWVVALTLCTSVGILVAAIIYCKLVEKRKAYSMGFVKKSCVLHYLAGICLGSVMISLVYLSGVFTGCMQIDFEITEGKKTGVILLFLVGYLIRGMAEEALCRGFLLVSLTKRYTVSFSLILSSIFYAFLYGLNHDVSALTYVNLILFGYFMGLLFLRFENIWLVGAFHGVWNFIQFHVLGSEAGTDATSSLFGVTLAEGQDLIHGGQTGVSSGLLASVVLLAGIVILSLEMGRKGLFVALKPVENPYDKAYYEGFQQFMREKHPDVYGRFQNEQESHEEMTPVNEEMIRNAEKKHEKPEEKSPYQTAFDRDYFKN